MSKILLLLLVPAGLWAADEMTLYDLQAPATHSFEVRHDAAATTPGAAYFFDPLRPTSFKERATDRASGKPLTSSVVDGKTARASGSVDASTPDKTRFLRVALAVPVPKNAETRIRIDTTETDPAAYSENAAGLVFQQRLSVKRNLVILPKGYELTGSASPAIVSTGDDGRIRLSYLNDRDDQLSIRITARRLP
ncbi:MAG TPA: hypothetical protein VKU19_09365 [Bryobacteraceae bacterium]|nr:hypothetical protein [Bryobacteraceae bacterium]